MPFQSLVFIFIFLPVTVVGYFLINRFHSAATAKCGLVFASMFFYGYWNILYIPILLTSIVCNYWFSREMGRPKKKTADRNRRTWLVIGIVFNLALLGYFKYANFLIGNFDLLLGHSSPLIHVMLPLGLSFFTLQQIAFLVDTYENISEESSFLNYLLFVSFFPYLTSGPITHHREVIPQFEDKNNRVVDYKNLATGLFIFSIGLFKKVMIAGSLDGLVNAAHGGMPLSFIDAWCASYAYMLQLYFDFSGYSDMAIALGLMLNIHLPMNFNSPLKATNIVEFWRRWHISLANFMRTYIFTAIMRTRAHATFVFSLAVSFITMVTLGIWHGAGWNYCLFGCMHGLAVVIFSIWQKFKIKLPNFIGWFVLFNFINLSVIPIRAVDLNETLSVLKGMVGLNGFVLPIDFKSKIPALEEAVQFAPLHFGSTMLELSENIAFLFMLILLVTAIKNSMEWGKMFKPRMEYLLVMIFLFVTSVLNLSHVSEFIYFQF